MTLKQRIEENPDFLDLLNDEEISKLEKAGLLSNEEKTHLTAEVENDTARN